MQHEDRQKVFGRQSGTPRSSKGAEGSETITVNPETVM